MKWVILHNYTAVVYCQQLPPDTRPFYNIELYTQCEFDTEVEMLQYIKDNNLEMLNETD